MAFTPVTIFPRNVPGFIAGGVKFTFDAALEDTLTAEVRYTQFPLEAGAHATDHGIILPKKWYLTAAVSNNPLNTTLAGFVEDNLSGFVSNIMAKYGFTEQLIASTATGIASGYIGGSNIKQVSVTRSADTLSGLITIMLARIPFDIEAVDITLKNMVITKISRTRKPETENGLLFTAELMELPTISTTLSNQHPGQGQLRPGSPEQTQATAKVNKGEVAPKPISASDLAEVRKIFPGAK